MVNLRVKFYLLVVTVSVLCHVNNGVAQGFFSNAGSKGKKHYEAGELEEELKIYREAQIENSDSPELAHNIGNVLYKQAKYDEASNEYLKAISAKAERLKGNAYYNIGNSLFRMGAETQDQEKLAGAIESYKRALEVSPSDMDAKHNIEFVKKFLQEMKQQQQPQNQDQNQDGQNQEQQQGQNENQDEQQDQRENQAQDQNQEQPQQAQSQEQQLQSRAQEGKMSKEEAERLLEALKNEDKEFQKQKLQRKKARSRTVEKDW